jgi:hypothetical protein
MQHVEGPLRMRHSRKLGLRMEVALNESSKRLNSDNGITGE